MAKRNEIKRVEIVHHSADKLNKSKSNKNIEKKLIENLVQLQKVHTNLAEKLDKLAEQISNLLALFEMSARSFATHPSIMASEKDKEFLDKVDKLLDQNKTIAKGLTLMEERIREKVYGPSSLQREATPRERAEIKEEEYKQSQYSTNRPTPKF